MGYNTPILILNDHIHDIENNPEQAVEAISKACSTTPTEIERRFQKRVASGICTVGTAHADMTRIIYAGGNTMTDLANKRFSLADKSKKEKQRLKEKAQTVKDEMERLIKDIVESQKKDIMDELSEAAEEVPMNPEKSLEEIKGLVNKGEDQ